MLLKEDWKHGSSKMEKFLDELDQVLSRGSRVLVFSQFTLLAIVQQELRARSIKNFYLDGQTPGMQEPSLSKGFKLRVFRLSYLTESGGTGLTFKVDVVFHLDPWWNPAVGDQATDRVYRMGQTKPVTVYRFVADTVEEKIYKIQEKTRSFLKCSKRWRGCWWLRSGSTARAYS